jgi:hypothetical protein
MKDTGPMNSIEDADYTSMSGPTRVLVCIFGLLTLGFGVFATFKTTNGAGSTSLILVGVFALLCSGMKQWPTKIILSGNVIEITKAGAKAKREIQRESDEGIESLDQNFQEAQKVITDLALEVIANAEFKKKEGTDLSGNASSDLNVDFHTDAGATLEEIFVPRVIDLVQNETAYKFDNRLVDFVTKNFGHSALRSVERYSKFRPDYELFLGNGGSLYVESKYVSPPAKRFLGKTLDGLIKGLPENAKLLVVTNVDDVEVARAKLHDFLGADRADVVCWRGPNEDAYLVESIRRLAGLNL